MNYCNLYQGNCLDLMQDLPDSSIDMVFADLPYGTTYAQWDSIIDISRLWQQYERIIKGNGAIILTASQPFTSLLVTSNIKWFRCEWIWDKVNGANFANANHQPLKVHESVLVFARGKTIYNPIKTLGKLNHKQGSSVVNKSDTRLINKRTLDDESGMKFPRSIQIFPKHSSQCGLHPTQKPVELAEYFIRTYSNEDETVLDNCMGSGSTGVAAINAKRHFVGMELDKEYFQTAFKRLNPVPINIESV